MRFDYSFASKERHLLFRRKSGFGKAYPGQEPLPAFREVNTLCFSDPLGKERKPSFNEDVGFCRSSPQIRTLTYLFEGVSVCRVCISVRAEYLLFIDAVLRFVVSIPRKDRLPSI